MAKYAYAPLSIVSHFVLFSASYRYVFPRIVLQFCSHVESFSYVSSSSSSSSLLNRTGNANVKVAAAEALTVVVADMPAAEDPRGRTTKIVWYKNACLFVSVFVSFWRLSTY